MHQEFIDLDLPTISWKLILGRVNHPLRNPLSGFPLPRADRYEELGIVIELLILALPDLALADTIPLGI